MGVKSDELGVKSDELGVKSDELGVKSDELGVKSDELGVKSDELGVKSDELGVKSDEKDGFLMLIKRLKTLETRYFTGFLTNWELFFRSKVNWEFFFSFFQKKYLLSEKAPNSNDEKVLTDFLVLTDTFFCKSEADML